MLDVKHLGQVYTPDYIVEFMLSLVENQGRTLEPSCGAGAFTKYLSGDVVSIDVDDTNLPSHSIRKNFFNYSKKEKFDTVIGNPPYVKHTNITKTTKKLLDYTLLDNRSNLYLFFIEKCVKHLKENGELIFITPRDFIKATSCAKLNTWLSSKGRFTHFIDLGDSKVFPDAILNCAIWRFEKNKSKGKIKYLTLSLSAKQLENELQSPKYEKREFLINEGQIIITNETLVVPFSSIASVKVGAVSGMDSVFSNAKYGNKDFVFSKTVSTGNTRRMVWSDDGENSYLKKNKKLLLTRKIKQFDESNWWTWGRSYPITDAKRVYVNTKTRNNKPFFLHPCNNFDGSVLAIFPKFNINLTEFRDALNELDWESLGFVSGGRFLFSQKSLESMLLPTEFNKFLKDSIRKTSTGLKSSSLFTHLNETSLVKRKSDSRRFGKKIVKRQVRKGY